jgi:hypothetical protein
MNWKTLFLLGLILAISPLHFKIQHYIFFYSVLGYGLMLFSFLLKENSKKDLVLINILLFILFTGLLNLFFWYSIFQTLFLIVFLWTFCLESKSRWAYRLSLALTGTAGFLMSLQLGSLILPVPLFLSAAAILFYICFIAGIVLFFIMEFTRISKKQF